MSAISGFCEKCNKFRKRHCDGNRNTCMSILFDTIESQQQQNEQLKDENASLRNWNACEEKLNNEYRAQAARIKEALKDAIYSVRIGSLRSIGRLNNVYAPQIYVSQVNEWEQIISDTPTDYHNPDDVGEIEQLKYLLRRALPILEVSNDNKELIDAIDKAIGGKEDA